VGHFLLAQDGVWTNHPVRPASAARATNASGVWSHPLIRFDSTTVSLAIDQFTDQASEHCSGRAPVGDPVIDQINLEKPEFLAVFASRLSGRPVSRPYFVVANSKLVR
jgi:hypothetical protein